MSLASDGCVYETNNSEPLFVPKEWSKYVKNAWKQFLTDKRYDELVDTLTNSKRYQEQFGYAGLVCSEVLGTSCQYSSISTSFLTCEMLDKQGIDFVKTVPEPNFQKWNEYVEKWRSDRLEYYSDYANDENIPVYINRQKVLFGEPDFESLETKKPEYIWLPIRVTQIERELPDKIKLLRKRIDEVRNYYENLYEITLGRGLSSAGKEVIHTLFKNHVELKWHKAHSKSGRSMSQEEWYGRIQWTSPDLCLNDCGFHCLEMPKEDVPQEYATKVISERKQYCSKHLNLISSVQSPDDVMHCMLDYSDMWTVIPQFFEALFPSVEIECTSADSPHLHGPLLNDWTDNYRIGIMMHILKKKEIIKRVSSFVCWNT